MVDLEPFIRRAFATGLLQNGFKGEMASSIKKPVSKRAF
jgi:hypothetical protein